MLGNWLYGVAHQTALQARRTSAWRRAKEVQVTKMPDTKAVEPDGWADLQPLLDEELSRLPDIYRAAIVLCDLEGRTRKEVASQLGLPEGTVASRVARARILLAKRLARNGVTVSGGTLAGVLSQKVASEGVPTSVMTSTIKALTSVAAGQVAAAGVISPQVAALTEGVMKSMMLTKLKTATMVLLALGSMVAFGGSMVPRHTATAQQVNSKEGGAEKPPSRKTDLRA
jgi:predicted DNA-binding protein (UPF0251 family)